MSPFLQNIRVNCIHVTSVFVFNILFTFGRIGEYSYIGDDGKTYTVKYSAGVDGFRYTRTLLKKINFAHFLIYQEIFPQLWLCTKSPPITNFLLTFFFISVRIWKILIFAKCQSAETQVQNILTLVHHNAIWKKWKNSYIVNSLPDISLLSRHWGAYLCLLISLTLNIPLRKLSRILVKGALNKFASKS